MNSGFDLAILIPLLQATIRMATPYTLAAIAGIYSEKAGVISIELEGILLIGAFAGFAGAYFTHSLWLGVLIAVAFGVALAAIYAFMTVNLGCKQALIGTAIVLLASGITSFFYRSLFGISSNIASVTPLKNFKLPILGQIPLVGDIFFDQNALVYLSYLLVAFTWFFYERTALGLSCRSVGENPYAADTLGLPVIKLRFISVLVTGAIAATGGAYMSIATSSTFIENMSSEKGYGAFAIIILGRYRPIGAFLGCLLYGFADALQLNLQATGINVPYQFMLMLPYLFTLVVMFISGKGEKPEGLGKFFEKGALLE
jgi:simple sugar transport system permease protein